MLDLLQLPRKMDQTGEKRLDLLPREPSRGNADLALIARGARLIQYLVRAAIVQRT